MCIHVYSLNFFIKKISLLIDVMASLDTLFPASASYVQNFTNIDNEGK